jgi:hypothetical protein
MSVAGGLLLICAVFAIAFLPEMRARPKKPWLAEPSGEVDHYPYSNGPTDQC